MNVLGILSWSSFCKSIPLSTRSYASLRSTKRRWDRSFLLLFISRIVFKMNILSLQDLDARKPFCSGPTMSSLSTAPDGRFARILVHSLDTQLIRVIGL